MRLFSERVIVKKRPQIPKKLIYDSCGGDRNFILPVHHGFFEVSLAELAHILNLED